MKTVQIDLDHCVGVTDYNDRHHYADKHGNVTVDDRTARDLLAGHAVRRSRRVFGGFDLPKAAPKD